VKDQLEKEEVKTGAERVIEAVFDKIEGTPQLGLILGQDLIKF
jgi:hypothetical protein